MPPGKRPDLIAGGLVRSYGSWGEIKKSAQSGRLKSDERILGDSAFVERILSGQRLTARETARQTGVTLESLVSRVGDLYDITADKLRSGSRRSLFVEARSVFCFWAVRHGGFSAASVAAFLGMTPPGVGYAADRGEEIARGKGYEL